MESLAVHRSLLGWFAAGRQEEAEIGKEEHDLSSILRAAMIEPTNKAEKAREKINAGGG